MRTFGSIFSGIGGIDLGLERAGWTCRWQIELDPFCQRVLAKHWPDAPTATDIRAVDWAQVEPVDLLAGGFPCQPVSVAGKRRGVRDARWLWPEFARAIVSLRPRWVLVENVPGLRTRGFAHVLGDLAAAGYDAEWNCVPASAFGAPHRRSRLFIVAHTQCIDLRLQCRWCRRAHGEGPLLFTRDGAEELVADLGGARCNSREPEEGREIRNETRGAQLERLGRDVAHAHPPGLAQRPEQDVLVQREAPERDGWWATEPDVGRVVHGVPPVVDRVARIRALGNACVPQVIEWIGRRIAQLDDVLRPDVTT